MEAGGAFDMVRPLVLVAFLSGCSAIGPDKALHFIGGTAAGAVADDLGVNGCAVALGLGVAKELIDPIFSLPDVIATAAYCIFRKGRE